MTGVKLWMPRVSQRGHGESEAGARESSKFFFLNMEPRNEEETSSVINKAQVKRRTSHETN